MKNNYRVDIFRKLIDNSITHYQVEFPEYYLSKIFANAILNASDIESIYILERISDNSFDITEKIK